MWQASYWTTMNFKDSWFFFSILSPKMFKRLESCSALTQICAVRVCWRVNRGGYHVNQYWLKRERTSILHSASLQSVKTAAAPVCASHVSYAEISAFYLEDKYLVVFKNPEGCLITLWEGFYRVLKRLFLPSGRKIFHPQWDKKKSFSPVSQEIIPCTHRNKDNLERKLYNQPSLEHWFKIHLSCRCKCIRKFFNYSQE